MKRIHIFNPVSGNGHSPEILGKGLAAREETYVTTGVGDAERFVAEVCAARPDTHFMVYGGDGTVNEVVNGIMKSGAESSAMMSVVPAGTGNDFVRTFPEKNKIYTIDVMKYNDRYAVNIINMGFDSRVVTKTEKYKKIMAGSAAYLAGVADSFFHKFGENWQMSIVDEQGSYEVLDGEYTLALCANCQYYGGGFRAAGLADPADGLIDLIAIKKVSRMAFAKRISAYKKGGHFDYQTGQIKSSFRDIMIYRRCRQVTVKGLSDFCVDGEIEKQSEISVQVISQKIRIAT